MIRIWWRKTIYDSIGNLIKTVDTAGRETKKVYHPRGWILAEIDTMGRISYNRLNELGNPVGVTDLRGVVKTTDASDTDQDIEVLGETYVLNPEYTDKMEYDSLGNTIKTSDRDKVSQ